MEISPDTSKLQSDEIDLFELIEGLWKEKLLIIGVSIFTLIAGAIFAFSQTPVYKATLHLTQPDPATLSPLTGLTLYSQISSQEPLTDFVTELQSISTRETFINQTAPELKDKLYPGKTQIERLKNLDKLITLSKSDEKKGNGLYPWTVKINTNNPMVAAAELNRLADLATKALQQRYKERYASARETTLAQLEQKVTLESEQLKAERLNQITRLEEAHQLKLRELEDQLAAQKQLYQAQLNDRFKLLEEAYATAKALGILEPTKGSSAVNGNKVEVQLRNDNDPLYFRGTKMLSEELIQLKTRPDDFFPDETIRELEAELQMLAKNRKIEMLKNRTSDIAFSDSITAMQKQVAKLESEIFPTTMQLAFSRTPAVADPQKLKPKRAMILALSLILGGMLGIFAALIRQAVKKRQPG
ncbi:Wzz/FepE/Etk N-terminal domain-containing protein [Pontibacter sp. JAM-7]|uniref:Wzz/FepE/Etk N-terminal domain-containing protein n=1 Tax=Pontibacter sp. JAM-7 TaxID=3366581 RepID=UPI003AF8FDD5